MFPAHIILNRGGIAFETVEGDPILLADDNLKTAS